MPLHFSITRPLKDRGFQYRCYLALQYIVVVLLTANSALAQTEDSTLSAANLKKLSLEALMNIEVTSGDDIRSSGVKTLPEALKLAANLQVAQVNASQWAISSRGFNNVLANKLLVLIDGRTVYTPMYAGVFWDVQNVLLEDVDRIEG
jgi:iron complex outermembrane recepter protein